MKHSEVTAYLKGLDDFWVLARTILFESAGEPLEGQEAVAAVVLNRAASPGWPDTVKEVCLQKNQFSCFNAGAGGISPDKLRYPWRYFLMSSWKQAKNIAERAFRGELSDRTNGATFYRNPRTATSGWFQKQIDTGKFVLTIRIARHDFYREKNAPQKIDWSALVGGGD